MGLIKSIREHDHTAWLGIFILVGGMLLWLAAQAGEWQVDRTLPEIAVTSLVSHR